MSNVLRRTAVIAAVIGSAIFVASMVAAQPINPPGIGRVSHTARFTGSGLSTNQLELNIAGASCGAGSAVGTINALGSGTCIAVGTGTITGVTAGSGLTGGGTSGSVTVDVGAGNGITVAADAVSANLGAGLTFSAGAIVPNLAGASCSASQAITALSAAGAGTCSTVGDITSVVAGTNMSGGATSGDATVNLATAVDQSASGSSLTVGDIRNTVLAVTISTCAAGACDDWAPTNHAKATTFEVTPSGGSRTITGLQGGVHGRIITICNTPGSAQLLAISGENSTSTAANRFKTADGNTGGASSTLSPSMCADFYYSTANNRWNEREKTRAYNIIADNNVTSNGTITAAGLISGGTIQGGGWNINGYVAPFSTVSSLSGDVNDWTPTSFNVSANVQIDPGAADRTITGMTSGFTNRWVVLWNTSTTKKVTLPNQSGSSTAANRFALPGSIDYVIHPERSVTVYYASSRWYVSEEAFRGTGTANTISKWSSANVLTDSSLTDDGTTAGVTGKFEVTVASGNTKMYGTGEVVGNFTTSGGFQKDTGTLPTVTSCGTGATRTGGEYSGTVTEGTISTGCVISFATALSGTPSCVVTSESALAFTYTVSTSAITITNVGALSSTALDFDCKGH